mmetsp:Transcript_32981/g.54461  ORF Transcript_32981/g.54461 Transcript_32981/m.54461 type:complete len:201 (+) Transcript_32981:180-782(+)
MSLLSTSAVLKSMTLNMPCQVTKMMTSKPLVNLRLLLKRTVLPRRRRRGRRKRVKKNADVNRGGLHGLQHPKITPKNNCKLLAMMYSPLQQQLHLMSTCQTLLRSIPPSTGERQAGVRHGTGPLRICLTIQQLLMKSPPVILSCLVTKETEQLRSRLLPQEQQLMRRILLFLLQKLLKKTLCATVLTCNRLHVMLSLWKS